MSQAIRDTKPRLRASFTLLPFFRQTLRMRQGHPKEIRVQIREEHGVKASEGIIRVQSWTKKQRTLRAIKFCLIFWGLALGSVLLPLLHFILVPAFFLAGPILAIFTMGRESVLLGGEGTCPSCQAPLPIARSAPRFPVSDLCTKCQRAVRIEPANARECVRNV